MRCQKFTISLLSWKQFVARLLIYSLRKIPFPQPEEEKVTGWRLDGNQNVWQTPERRAPLPDAEMSGENYAKHKKICKIFHNALVPYSRTDRAGKKNRKQMNVIPFFYRYARQMLLLCLHLHLNSHALWTISSAYCGLSYFHMLKR